MRKQSPAEIKAIFARKNKFYDPKTTFQIIPNEPRQQKEWYEEAKNYFLARAKNTNDSFMKQHFAKLAINANQNIRGIKV